ncbi:MAG: hypothetical protein KAQ64_01215 [Candidatus Pacebacteria bacterium]|nr:hypothetical protein [Candidatus Paceibacterota bacterium]
MKKNIFRLKDDVVIIVCDSAGAELSNAKIAEDVESYKNRSKKKVADIKVELFL